ncbi:MAG: glycosyltransferase [Eubacteriales bacterium]|nr:glycosyltransferase [Eubacteriales bacterium]
MKKTVVYYSSCALDAKGAPGSFLLQELPWLLAHFDRVALCSYYGVAELTEPRPARVAVRRPALGAVRAYFAAPFSRPFLRELNHLRQDGRLSPINALKLLMFTVRGLKLHYWTETMLKPDEQTTLYSFWMSYDAFAAALSKRRHPAVRAVARGHHFDINVDCNPMNPYLMKQFLGETLDTLYPISLDALGCLNACAALPPEKLHVLALGSHGGEATERFDPPFYQDGVLRIVSCAAVIERKQLPVLVDALADWRGGPVRWLHMGGGPDEEAVRAYAKQRLGDRVAWEITGTVNPERVVGYYAGQPFDVFVNSSRSEGVPVSIMEAMRAGILIVAPEINGIPELVDESFGVLYSPSADAAALRGALEQIAALPREQALAMRATAQARWNERCRSDRLLETLFPEAIEGGGKS